MKSMMIETRDMWRILMPRPVAVSRLLACVFCIAGLASCQQPTLPTGSISSSGNQANSLHHTPAATQPSSQPMRQTPSQPNIQSRNLSQSFQWDFSQPAREWKYIVIHHTATNTGSVASIHQSHLNRKDSKGNPWRGIGYHFVIGNGNGMPDGEIESTFRWDEQTSGAHAGDNEYNRHGIGVCLVGNFEDEPPTSRQLDSLKQLTAELSNRFRIQTEQIIGHSDVKATKCPGRLFPMQQITNLRDVNGPVEPANIAKRDPANEKLTRRVWP